MQNYILETLSLVNKKALDESIENLSYAFAIDEAFEKLSKEGEEVINKIKSDTIPVINTLNEVVKVQEKEVINNVNQIKQMAVNEVNEISKDIANQAQVIINQSENIFANAKNYMDISKGIASDFSKSTKEVLVDLKGKVVGKAIGKVVGKAIGKVVGKAIGKAIGKVMGKAIGKVMGKAMGKSLNVINQISNLKVTALEGKRNFTKAIATKFSEITKYGNDFIMGGKQFVNSKKDYLYNEIDNIQNLGTEYIKSSKSELQNLIQLPAKSLSIMAMDVKNTGESIAQTGLGKADEYVRNNLSTFESFFGTNVEGTGKDNFSTLNGGYNYKNSEFNNSVNNPEGDKNSNIQTNYITTNVMVETSASANQIASATSSEILKVQTNLLNDRNKYK